MGAGGLADDFPHDAFLADLVAQRVTAAPAGEFDLVFNGDTFDFLRTAADGFYPAHVTAEIAMRKLDVIARAHRVFFDGLKSFLQADERRRVHFIVGNHDAELLFPEVQTRIARLCGEPARTCFPGFSLELGPIRIEHGSQRDPMFAMPEDRPFVEFDGRPILNLSWGALAVIHIWGRYNETLGALDRIKPRARLFDLVPEAKTLMLRRSWRYFAHEFWKDFRNDPLKYVSWAMFKEVTYRFLTADADVGIRARYCEALAESAAEVLVIGHEHRASRTRVGDKLLVTTGCMRDEYRLDDESNRLRPADKGALQVRLTEDRILETTELTFPAPEPPPGHMPRDLDDLALTVRAHLNTDQ